MSNDKGPPVTVKIEPGTYKRLPSFRTPRDLKLSEYKPANAPDSKPRKVYIPNLNVQRKKVNEESSAVVNNDATKPDRCKRSEERTRGRGRKQPNLVQGTGVFSEGLAPSVKTGRWISRNSESSPSFIPKPKLNLTDKIKIDKDEEDLVMRELMRDDFIDDPELEPDFTNCPVKLPLCEFDIKPFKKEEKHAPEDKQQTQLVNGLKIKKEVENEETMDMKSDLNVEKPRLISEMKPLSVQEILNKSVDTSFIFLQLPNCLPGLYVKEEKHQSSVPSTSKSQDEKTPPVAPESQESSVLRNLPSGQIGKVQILKSGRARLVLGDAHLWIEPGTQPAFRQDLMSIPLNANAYTGSMVNLGPITTRMIVSPDWESMLKQKL